MSDEQGNLQIIQQNYAAFGRGDAQTILSVMIDDIEWESRYPASVPFGGVWRGHAGVKELFSQLELTLEVHQFQIQEFVFSGDKVIALGFEEATAKRTGRSYRNEWVHVWTVRDGLVHHVRNYNDTAAVAAAFA